MGIAEQVQDVESKIAAACSRAGRTRESVQLIAVSKTKPLSDMEEAYQAGCRDFGENYVQEILEKCEALPEDVRLHMIGHLQTNKVGKIVDKTAMIHAVDSLRLAKEINKQAEKRGLKAVKVLLEVNVAGEESKFGFSPEETGDRLSEIRENCPHVEVVGLMTSAPYTEEAEENRIYFRRLHALAQSLSLPELSMGMTGDYEVAIEEGATMVRVGTAIFGARDYSK